VTGAEDVDAWVVYALLPSVVDKPCTKCPRVATKTCGPQGPRSEGDATGVELGEGL
jgi:hypothetical protein